MIALLSSPDTMQALGPSLSTPTKELREAMLTDAIWNMHRIIANPAALGEEVAAAKRGLLRILKNPRAVAGKAAPLSRPAPKPARGVESTRPIRADAGGRAEFPKRAREAASAIFRADPLAAARTAAHFRRTRAAHTALRAKTPRKEAPVFANAAV